MSHIQEGGRQSPGNVLLVICPTWLSKRDGKVFCTQGMFVKSSHPKRNNIIILMIVFV